MTSKLKRAVDLKIFEIQSNLISEDADEDVLVDSILWLQPRHYEEVVEERSNDNRCGYPCCPKEIRESKAQFRINYKEKEIYKVENSAFYCSEICIQKSIRFQKSLDVSLPYSREICKTLDLSKAANSSIDDIFDILEPSKSSSKTSAKQSVNFDHIPPPFTSGSMSMDGKIDVQFEKGVVVAPKEPEITRAKAGSDPGPISVANPLPSPPGSPGKRPYIPKLIKKEQPQRKFDPSSMEVDEGDAESHTLPKEVHPKALLSGAKSSASEEDTAMRELYEKMDAIELKKQQKQAAGGAAHRKTYPSAKEHVWERQAPAAGGNGSGGGGERKSVTWSDREEVQWIDTKNVGTSAGQKDLSPDGRPNKLAKIDFSGSTATAESTALSSSSSTSAKSRSARASASSTIMKNNGMILERSNAAPLSAAALLTKHEPQLESEHYENANEVISADRVAKAQRQGSIEGYFSQFSAPLHVSGQTAMENLSYNPFAHWSHKSSGSGAARGSNTASADENAMDEEETDEGAAGGSGRGGGDADDDSSSTSTLAAEESEEITTTLAYSRSNSDSSLFLAVWSALEELFDSTSVLEATPTSMALKHVAVPEEKAEGDMIEPVLRNPVATERMQLMASINRSLERGLKVAEKLLDIPQSITLNNMQPQPIAMYQQQRNRLLAQINPRIQQCPPLTAAAWTIIGILLVDAVVRKSIFQPSTNETTVIDWSTTIEKVANSTCSGSKAATNTLRTNDIDVLRHFFDFYV